MTFLAKDELRAFCADDRDQLLTMWTARRRRLRRSRVPAEKLDEIIHDVLGFSIAYQSLPGNLLGHCDYDARRIIISSRIAEMSLPNTKIEGVVNSTKAHELGHIRFPHHEPEVRAELAAQMAAGFAEDWEGEDDTVQAEVSREYQANYYARLFLVPEKALRELEETCRIEEAWRGGHALASETLWPLVLRLADHFQVTGALMARRLKGMGWIRREGRVIAISGT